MCLVFGYFNLIRKYIDIILKLFVKCEIFIVYLIVNGFYEVKGVVGRFVNFFDWYIL